ncbi:hypothetical protein [Mycoplasmopsis opalescens]|uniref:hypothetical protein n=1 Tax=Mycoplasmopsis opalescens TaxID=114886 RepID=UPI0004A71E33|nr:hypothetical protein [Mycoplasmopsis opalescens]
MNPKYPLLIITICGILLLMFSAFVIKTIVAGNKSLKEPLIKHKDLRAQKINLISSLIVFLISIIFVICWPIVANPLLELKKVNPKTNAVIEEWKEAFIFIQILFIMLSIIYASLICLCYSLISKNLTRIENKDFLTYKEIVQKNELSPFLVNNDPIIYKLKVKVNSGRTITYNDLLAKLQGIKVDKKDDKTIENAIELVYSFALLSDSEKFENNNEKIKIILMAALKDLSYLFDLSLETIEQKFQKIFIG